jgi:hypothetical protein
MFFIYRRTYTATAAFSSQLDYVCALCGTHAVASVQAQGLSQSTAVYGMGGSADQASHGAHYAAQANAIGALQHAPCPRCGGYQPIVTSRFQAFNERAAKASKRALPIAAAVAAVALLIGIVPGIRDLKYSSALLVTVLLGVAALFAIVYAILRSPGPRPHIPYGAVHFWWGRHDGSVGWMPPPHVPAPPLAAPTSIPALGGTLGGLSAFACMIGLIVWAATFEHVYVVDYEDRAVTIDGADVTAQASTYGFVDKHVRRFDARTGQPHDVVIAGVKYSLPNNTHGWVVAPEAKQHDVCFMEYEAVYGGTKGVKPHVNVVELPANGVMVLMRSYDDMFQDSPKTQEVKAGETKRRWELRTVSCESLDEETKDDDAKKDSQPL